MVLMGLIMGSVGANASIFVGNGGEGVLVDGHVFLRDLSDNDLSQNLLIGPKRDKRVLASLGRSSLAGISVDLDLLARKLTDVNFMSPQLGNYLAAAASYYQWVLVKEKLAPIQDEGTPYSHEGYLPLANRYLSTVRIQRQLWEKMSARQRVALVVHELVFSLARPECDPYDSNCFQPSAPVREMVSLFFTHVGGVSLSVAQEKFLGLPEISDRWSCPLNELSADGKDMTTWKSRQEWIKDQCARNSDKVTARLFRPPFQLEEKFYRGWKTPGGAWNQMNLKVKFVPGASDLSLDLKGLTKTQCAWRLESALFRWVNYEASTLRGSPTYACYAVTPGND
jgi:hypothetical protein